MRPATIGLALGVIVALAGTRLMQQLLFDVKPGDPVSLAAAAVVLFVIAVVANWLPARRAASVDPVTALRSE
jgi:ABC-type antimicrobial peptide transport system permease subunit